MLSIAITVCFEGVWSLKARYVGHAFRKFGTIDHPNSLSDAITHGVAPVLYAGCLVRNMPKWTRWSRIAGTGFAMVGVILTISRMGFVTWCVVMLLTTVALRFTLGSPSRRP